MWGEYFYLQERPWNRLGGQPVSGAVSGVLRRIWGHINDLQSLWDMYEVIMWSVCVYLVCWEIPAAVAWLVFWRVWKCSTYYDQVEQINRIANCFWAENGCWGVYVDWTLRYLKDAEVGVRCVGGLISSKSEQTIIFQMVWRFSDEPAQSLIYWVARWHISKNYGPLCVVRDDVAFCKLLELEIYNFFCGRN